MSNNDNDKESTSSPTSPSQWTETELRQRITLLESVVKERNDHIEKLQRELRVANSKVRIVDEVQSENKVLRARLTEMMMKQQKQQQATSSSSSSSSVSSSVESSSATTTKEESLLEKLRRQLNETAAPSPLGSYDAASDDIANLPPTEEDQVEEVMNQAMDSISVEDKEERLLKERLEKLCNKK